MLPPVRPPPFPFPFRVPFLPSPTPTTSTRSLHTSSPSFKRFKPQPLFLRPGQTEEELRHERKAREADQLRAKRARAIKRIDLYKEAGFDTTDWSRNRIRQNKGMENWLALRKLRLITEGKLDPIEEERRERAMVVGRSARALDRHGQVREEDRTYGLKSESFSAAASWEQELEEQSWREDESAPEPIPSLDEQGNPLPFGLRYKPTHQPVPSDSLPQNTWSNSGLSTTRSGTVSGSASWSSDTKPDGSLKDWQAFAQEEKAVEVQDKSHSENPKLVSEVQRLLNLAAKAGDGGRESSISARPSRSALEDSAVLGSISSRLRTTQTADHASSPSVHKRQEPPHHPVLPRRSFPAPPSTKARNPNEWERTKRLTYTTRRNNQSIGPAMKSRPASGTPAWYQGGGKDRKTDRSPGGSAAGPNQHGLRSYSTDSRGGRRSESRTGFGRPAIQGMREASPRFPIRAQAQRDPRTTRLRPAAESAVVDPEDSEYRTGRPPRGSNGWSPTKRLSRPAMAGLKQLYQQDPQKHDRFFLSKEFGISVEAVNRILRSDGRWQKKGGKESSSDEPEV